MIYKKQDPPLIDLRSKNLKEESPNEWKDWNMIYPQGRVPKRMEELIYEFSSPIQFRHINLYV